jgi:hypothetical protein
MICANGVVTGGAARWLQEEENLLKDGVLVVGVARDSCFF